MVDFSEIMDDYIIEERQSILREMMEAESLPSDSLTREMLGENFGGLLGEDSLSVGEELAIF